ncbi:serine/threonine-protein kinase PknD [Antrihabitans sp. YC2-6]|uniref:serine/threonine-protein kinase PknD n=1 Tax=Antrihabitans sp. YC2-6 TaxID=2799498 RepID=UPI0018F2B481|nr:serine/threonine-protein kinase PknD [Antrihabitans sp. YC2-6]MBJ8344307.1 protein kinase [Antrihabitans sp. YC2-6]
MSGADLGPGDSFAGYTIEAVLGVGGMGGVYLANHPNLPRKVALKLLHRSLTADDYVRSRFEQEAEHAARLQHPNIVPVYDRGRLGDQLWIAMQYVSGTDASKLLRDGPLPPGRVIHIITETGRALDYAHSVGVLHRDVKPANILLADAAHPGASEWVLLADFGIAKAIDDTAHLTKSGMLVATLVYASPEQIQGLPLDHRADVYSLGCTLFHLLTGVPPYPGPAAATIMHGHLSQPIPRPSAVRPGISPAFDAVIGRALAKNREGRYPSCGELAAGARRALQARPPQPTVVRTVEPPRVAQPQTYVAAGGYPPSPGWAAPQQFTPGHNPGMPPPPSRHTAAIVAVAVALVLVGILAFVLWPSDSARKSTATGTTTATAIDAAQVQRVLPFTPASLSGLAVSATGDVYTIDSADGRVLKLPAGSATQEVVPFSADLEGPTGVAVRGSGEVYVIEYLSGKVLRSNGVDLRVVPFTGVSLVVDIAVDSSGNVYVTDAQNSRVLMLANGVGQQVVLPFDDLVDPTGVAVNEAGDVFVADSGNSRVLELAAGSDTAVTLPFRGLSYPVGIALNDAGDVFVADNGNNRVVKLATGSSDQVVLPFDGLQYPRDVAVGSNGSVYVVNLTETNQILELSAG